MATRTNIDKDQFFTNSVNVDFVLSKVNTNDFDYVVEPSAGDGAFSNKIKNCIAIDIEPKSENIIKADFLTYNLDVKGNILSIGNPPFGRQSSLAIKFINKCAQFSSKIVFILPNSFRKESVIDKLDSHIFLETVYELPSNTFLFEKKEHIIPCSLFIFNVDLKKERPKKVMLEIDDFEFVKKENATHSIQRVGSSAGKVKDLNVSEASHYFIRCFDETVIDRLKSITYDCNNTVGPKSISKNEIIKAYKSLKL